MKRWGRKGAEAIRGLLKAVRALSIWKHDAVRATLRHGLNAAIALAGVVMLDLAVHHYLSRRPEFQVRAPSLRWDPGVGAESIRGIDARLCTIDDAAMDETMIPRLADSLRQDPWVRRLHGIRRVYPNHLELDVEFRRPFLAVQHGDGFVLLDEERVRLPGCLSEPPPELSTPAVVGTMMTPPAPGSRWEGREIAVAFEMLELCRRSLLGTLSIATMDISNLDGRIRPYQCEVVLRLRSGCEILWGAPPSASRPLWEADVEGKLANLKRALELYPADEGRTIQIFEPGKIVYAPESR